LLMIIHFHHFSKFTCRLTLPCRLGTVMAAAAASRSSWKPLVRTAGIGFVGGVLIWGAGDVLGEFSTFWRLRDSAMMLANDNQELKEQIGAPFSLGPWYNASIGFTAGGNIAMCTFQLKAS
jgi:hypothetical protein